MPTTKNPQYIGYEYDISNWVIPLRNNILGLSFLTMTKELKYKKCNTVNGKILKFHLCKLFNFFI